MRLTALQEGEFLNAIAPIISKLIPPRSNLVILVLNEEDISIMSSLPAKPLTGLLYSVLLKIGEEPQPDTMHITNRKTD